MKKIYYYFTALLLTFMSCQDARDIDPVDLIDSGLAFGRIDDIQAALNTAYLSYRPENGISFSSRFVDDLRFGSQTGGQGANDIQQQLNISSGSTTTLWNGRYTAIGAINRFVGPAENFDTNDPAERTTLNNIIAQGLALRALAHLDLMAFYAAGTTTTDFNVFAAGNRAVPYITEVNTFSQPARNTVAEVSLAITEDLDRASSLLTLSGDNTIVTQEFITATRARLALYTGDNAAAIAFSNQLISQFPLADPTQYFNMFRDTDNTEVIWSLIRNQGAGGNPGGLFFFTASRGPFFEVSLGLADLLDPNDARRTVIIDEVTSDPGETRVGKYFGRPGENGRNNIKVFRVSEQYLIRAEAEARSGNLTAAASTMDALIDARFGSDQPTPVYASLEAAIRDILFQRRLELAYESHRYIDVRRTRDITGDGIVRDTRDCGVSGVPCTLNIDDARFAMPIPTSETDGNNVITQNPGY